MNLKNYNAMKETSELEQLLLDLYDYMDDIADADGDINGGFIPNEEMRFLGRIAEALDTLKQE